MTDEELRITTINLFGKLYSRIRNNELIKIRNYIDNHPLSFHVSIQTELDIIIKKLYYQLYIDRTKGCWIPEDWSHYHQVMKRNAHRFSFELMRGPILPDRMICHHCDRKGCRNPFHLFQGTASDNIKDAIKKGKIFIIRI